MFEGLGDKVRQRLKGWTEQMAGQERKEQLQALARTENEYGVDPFGFNLDYALAAVAPLLWLYKQLLPGGDLRHREGARRAGCC